MPPLKDIIGEKFNALTVIKYSHTNRNAYWLCKCDCGRETVVSAPNLKSGSIKTCGCKWLRRKYSPKESTWRYLWSKHQYSAEKRGLKYMSFKYYRQWLIDEPNCWYCGDPPPIRTYESGAPVKAHGIDRIDSSKGYIEGNIRTACKQCNYAKLDYSEEAFIEMCCKVVLKRGQEAMAQRSLGLLAA